jgi:pyruvate-formate lyase-activating enzyme
MERRSARQALLRRLPFLRHLRNADLKLGNAARVLRGEAFFCNALNGGSDYNICINADMTVSCNCVDLDGSGHLGDLRANTLREIFSGPTATAFRASLARGVLPIRRCLSCRELTKTSRAEARTSLSRYSPPTRGIMVENTVQCNLHCLNCNRTLILKTRKRPRMTLPDMEKVAREIRDNGIAVINFFNLGEPFLSDTIYEELSLLKEHNPAAAIYVSTNGALINREEKLEAALLADYIFFSLDGTTNESVNKYQAGGSFDATYRNMKELVRLRNSRGRTKPVIDWKYVVFSWNDGEAEIEKAVALAREARVDIISFWPGSGTPEQVSSRFKNDPYFRTLGSASWKGREFDFRK